MSLVFDKKGTRLDVLTALIWYKSLSFSSSVLDKLTANLSVVNSSGEEVKATIYNTQEVYIDYLGNWNCIALSIQAAEDFDKVHLEFKTNFDVRLYISTMLYDDGLITTYRYDEEGKIDATLSGKTCNYYKLNKDNQTLLSKNNVYSYDEKGRVIQSITPKKLVSSLAYDDKGNVTSQKVQKVNDTKFMGKQYTYSKGELLTKETNEDLTTITYGYDSYNRQNNSQLGTFNETIKYVELNNVNNGKVESVELKDGNIFNGKLKYEYDSSSNLSKATSTNDDIDKIKIKYAYDSKGRLNQISNYYETYNYVDSNIDAPILGPGMSIMPPPDEEVIAHNETLYQCTYDDAGNIKTYNYGDDTKNVSYEYEETDRSTLNNIKKVKYCNQNKYLFEYSSDGKGLLNKVTSYETVDENGDEITTNYEYKDNKLAAINTKGGTNTYHTNEFKYNQNGEVFIEKNTTGSNSIEAEYLDSSKITFDSINGFEYSLLCEQDDDLYWTMFIDRKIKRINEDYFIDNSMNLLNCEGKTIKCTSKSLDYEDEGLRFINFDLSNPYHDKGYEVSIRENIKSSKKLSIFFSFITTEQQEKNNLMIMENYDSGTHEFSIYSFENKLYFSAYKKISALFTGVEKSIAISNYTNILHTIMVNIEAIQIENVYTYNFSIFLDGVKVNNFSVNEFPFLNCLKLMPNYSRNNTANSNKLSTIIINTTKHISEEKYKEYTNRLKAIYERGETYPENFNITLDNNNTNEYDTIALHNTFESRNGLKPLTQLNHPKIANIQENFAYVDDVIDTGVGNYVYAMKKQTLQYDLGLSNSGMIGIRFKRMENKAATFMSLDLKNGFSFLVSNSFDQIYIRLKGSIIYQEYNSSDWNNVIITWSKQVQSASLDEGACQVKVYVNGTLVHTATALMSYDTLSTTLNLGKNAAETQVVDETIGYIDKVIYNDQFISDATAVRLNNELSNGYYLKDTFDDFGRKTSSNILTRGNILLNTRYNYVQNSSSDASIISTETNIPLRETLCVDNNSKEVRNYTFDNFGNVTNINVTDVFRKNTFKYAYVYNKNQISKDSFMLINSGNIDTETIKEYDYDGRGNITSIKENDEITKKFTYSQSGLLLTGVNDSVIEYDGLFPKTIKDSTGNVINELTFEDGKLKTLIDHKNNIKYRYFYNYAGLREQKRTYNKTTNALLSSIDYYYKSRNLLVSEVRNTYTNGILSNTYDIMYMYDSNGSLYGFKYDGSTYYYTKDILGNICNIMDSSGNLKSSYIYDAWGNHKVSSVNQGVSSTSIGNINPFRYKGYYYDVETQLYWVSSRYYSPELCRWISPDSIEYLDPESINGLNLYAYCGNDPINNYDPTGHFSLPNWAKWVIGGVAFVGAVALTYLTGGALAPVFIGMAGSILLDGVVEGAISSANGGNFWEGFADGAANGAMWGGIFALGGAALRTIKMFKNGVAIGENMKRVNNLAKAGHQITYKGMPGFKFVKMFGGDDLARTLSMRHNQAFIERMMKWGVKIVDFGIDTSRNYRSFYYLMETIVSNGYGLLQLMY